MDDWIQKTGDRGQLPVPQEQLRATLQRWGAKCRNPEYDAVKAKHPELWKPKDGS